MVVLPPCKQELNTGKDFRVSLHKPSNIPRTRKQKPKIRLVPAFTIQAVQQNTKVIPPPLCNLYRIPPGKPSPFRRAYLRSEIPAFIQFTGQGRKLGWQIPVEKLDYRFYLPLFLSGLAEDGYPFNYIVENGISTMVDKCPTKVLPCVPQLIAPLKAAYETKRPSVIIYANKCIQSIVKHCPKVGEALVPYYCQLIPGMALFLAKKRSTTSDNVIVRENDVYYSIEDTLTVLELMGGPDSYINIKYFVPSYESCMRN